MCVCGGVTGEVPPHRPRFKHTQIKMTGDGLRMPSPGLGPAEVRTLHVTLAATDLRHVLPLASKFENHR